jgi:hypothetical protein
MFRLSIDSTTESGVWLAATDEVKQHGDDADERRGRVVTDFRLLARSQMSPTGSAIGLLGEGKATAIVALQVGVRLLGFERSRSRHGPWYERGKVPQIVRRSLFLWN